MLRLLATPRWLGTTAFMVVAVVVCVWLGSWQYGVAEQEPRALSPEQERAAPVTDVVEAYAPDASFPVGLKVRAVGKYQPDSFVAKGVDAAGATGSWAVSPLILDGGAGTLAVVRGYARPAPSAPHDGSVVVTGRIQPAAPATLIGGLTAELLRAKGMDPRGYLVLIDQQPPDARPAKVVDSPAPAPTGTVRRWQNTAYAFQWWFFGAFTVFAWARFLREDFRSSRAEKVDA